MKSVADFLKLPPDREAEAVENLPDRQLSPQAFCEWLVRSEAFRVYLVEGLMLRTLPSAVVVRILDQAWGKPPDRLELTGRNGDPIESITEVRRVVVCLEQPRGQERGTAEMRDPSPYKTH